MEALAAHIMVVDDEEGQRSDLAAMVQSFGFQVMAAKEGRDALNKLAAFPASAILTDLVMPGMDGFAFLRELALRAIVHLRLCSRLLAASTRPSRWSMT